MSSTGGFRWGMWASALACAGCLVAPGAGHAGTLDQEQGDTGGSGSAIYQGQSAAQSFTDGITGGLDQVDLALKRGLEAPSTYLSVEIRDLANGAPGGLILASNAFTSPDIPISPDSAFFMVDFAPPAPVVAGTQYAIVVYSGTPSTANHNWVDSSFGTNPYGPGAQFVSPATPPTAAGPWFSDSSGPDFAFRTYVVPSSSAPPPQPPQTGPNATGERAAALKKCKKKRGKKRKRCRKRAKKLPR